MQIYKKALLLHKKLHGKLSVSPKIDININNLALVYTPGVAEAVKNISKNKMAVYDLTIKNNSIAVVTDGSAVLGIGNVGPLAALPVMEGKCAIFKKFAGIDAYPICLNTQNIDEIVLTVENISPGFAGINLEDISAPRCFEIEGKLQNLGIPVMHDDQHATAIVVLAGLLNAIKITGKSLTDCKIVVVGCGAAGTAIVKLLAYFGIKNLIIIDSKGIISPERKDLNRYKKELIKITNPNIIVGNLEIGVRNADILIGVSKKGLFTKRIIASMHERPVVFALANPEPEMNHSQARDWGVRVFATGRSDCPNQINNALVFPGFFKGLLKWRINKITNKMKVRAAFALGSLVVKPKPDQIIPSIFDKRVVPAIVNSIKS